MHRKKASDCCQEIPQPHTAASRCTMRKCHTPLTVMIHQKTITIKQHSLFFIFDCKTRKNAKHCIKIRTKHKTPLSNGSNNKQYKLSVLFMEQGQTVQTQIRRHRTWCLIGIFTVCSKYVSIKISNKNRILPNT